MASCRILLVRCLKAHLVCSMPLEVFRCSSYCTVEDFSLERPVASCLCSIILFFYVIILLTLKLQVLFTKI